MNELVTTAQISTSWIESLALEELNMDESGIVHFEDHLNPVHYLEEESIRFVSQIRDLCEVWVNRFNEYRGRNSDSSQIRLFKIAGTVNDFMLFRNSLRLIFARRANDLISVGFLSSSGEIYPAKLFNQAQNVRSAHEIRAHLGPFNNITWQFAGEPIEIETMVKYYLTEFIRKSAK